MRFREIPQFTRYGDYQINVSLKYLPKLIGEYIKDMNLQLEPDFQRGHVWSQKQQVKFIEYLLKGGKSNRTIYFNHPHWHVEDKNNSYKDFVIVDGLQRITAVMKFVNNEIKVFDNYCQDFEDKMPMDIDLLFNVNNLQTREEVLRWYIEMNEGGTPHTEEEIIKVVRLLELEISENNFREDKII